MQSLQPLELQGVTVCWTSQWICHKIVHSSLQKQATGLLREAKWDTKCACLSYTRLWATAQRCKFMSADAWSKTEVESLTWTCVLQDQYFSASLRSVLIHTLLESWGKCYLCILGSSWQTLLVFRWYISSELMYFCVLKIPCNNKYSSCPPRPICEACAFY